MVNVFLDFVLCVAFCTEHRVLETGVCYSVGFVRMSLPQSVDWLR
jgi:hypothetical protein